VGRTSTLLHSQIWDPSRFVWICWCMHLRGLIPPGQTFAPIARIAAWCPVRASGAGADGAMKHAASFFCLRRMAPVPEVHTNSSMGRGTWGFHQIHLHQATRPCPALATPAGVDPGMRCLLEGEARKSPISNLLSRLFFFLLSFWWDPLQSVR